MENPLLSLTLADLRERHSLKWRLYGADVLPLWVAEMDILPPEPVTRAVSDAMTRGDTGYPWARDYAEAVAGFADRHWGWAPDPARARLVPNVMLGISEVLKLVTGPGDAVVVNPPVYPPFYAFIGNLGRRVVEAPLGTDGRLDLAALDTAFGEARRGGGPTAYLLCSPHNPTGVVHTPEELMAAGELAAEHGVRVVVDEIHAPLVYDAGAFTPYLSLPVGSTAFSLMSASKCFNLAGLPSALALAGAEAQRDLARMPEEVAFGASHLGALAQAAALREGTSGWARSSPGSTRTADCSRICSQCTFPTSGTACRTRPTSRGWTAGPWGWARTPPQCSASVDAWHSAPARPSAPGARDMPASTSPPPRTS